ncbi:hypothetical protein ACWC0C_13550, partial [Streptomyces sp. NPDC001709]
MGPTGSTAKPDRTTAPQATPLRPRAPAGTPAPVGPVDGTTDAGDTPTDDSPAATAEPTSADSPTT